MIINVHHTSGALPDFRIEYDGTDDNKAFDKVINTLETDSEIPRGKYDIDCPGRFSAIITKSAAWKTAK